MSGDRHDSLVRRQFGASAEHYRTSATHARGRSLEKLQTLVRPQPDWTVLDTATGAGHTAAALAPRAALVVAGDMTREMLEQARTVSRERNLGVLLVQESAQSLSYRDDTFDLVTCRVAAHHFADPAAFVAEGARVLKPGGRLAVVDNIVPGDPADAAWINDFERRRDPSHARCLSRDEWRAICSSADFHVEHEEVNAKWFDFEDWMRRMNAAEDRIKHLGEALMNAPEGVRRFWQPKLEQGRIKLALQEVILIGRLGE